MKILIIGFYTKTYMPYIQKYEEILEENQIEYFETFFDRDSDGTPTFKKNAFTYHKKMGTKKWKKVIPYFSYISYVKKLIKKDSYDKLIILTTVPAVLLYRVLTKKYANLYIFDFRDYSYEKYSFYKRLVDKIIAKSYCTFISSKGFMHYLSPNPKINIVHNISNIDSNTNKAAAINMDNIVIGFVGYVRYYDINTSLISILKDYSNIKIQYYGTMYDDCDLKSYVKNNHVSNVDFFDTYQNDEKPQIYQNMTFINSIYSLQSKEVAFAVPNRLYDAALYKKPIIVARGTYLEKIVNKYGLGFAVDLSKDNLYQEILSYVNNYNEECFTQNCQRFITDVLTDEKNLHSKVTRFLK